MDENVSKGMEASEGSHEGPAASSGEGSMLVRVSSLAAGTALLTLSAYFWWLGGYLGPVNLILQWAYALAGGAFVVRSLLPDARNGFLEGRGGLLTSSLLLATLTYFLFDHGITSPYTIIEVYLAGFAIMVIVNSASKPPILQRKRAATVVAGTAFALISLGLVAYSFGDWPFTAFFIFMFSLAVAGLTRWGRSVGRLFPIIFIVELAAIALLLVRGFPQLSSDELIYEAYAAHLVMVGGNPYATPSLAGAYSFFHIQFKEAVLFMTPLSTGGFVTWLSYPALSFLIYVPALLLDTDPRAVLFILTFLLLLVILIKYRRSGLWGLTLLVLLVILADPSAVYYPLTSVTDIGWAFLLALSLLFRKRPWAAGGLYGLSVAVKQIPLVVLPYYLYMIYRERGKGGAASFGLAGIATFLITNLPFIATSPAAWMSAIVSPEGGQLIGIGQGAGAISFLGYYALPYYYFLAMEALTAVALLTIYIYGYDRYRYAFLAFPIFIFFFNYRDLFNYIVYWPLLAIVVLPNANSELRAVVSTMKKAKWRRAEALLVAALIVTSVGLAAYAHGTTARQSSGAISISSVGAFQDPLGVPGSVTSMAINVTSILPAVQFRLFSEGPLISGNGLLWHEVNRTLGDGWVVYTIEPDSPSMALPYNSSQFRVEAYYGGYQAFYQGHFDANGGP